MPAGRLQYLQKPWLLQNATPLSPTGQVESFAPALQQRCVQNVRPPPPLLLPVPPPPMKHLPPAHCVSAVHVESPKGLEPASVGPLTQAAPELLVELLLEELVLDVEDELGAGVPSLEHAMTSVIAAGTDAAMSAMRA